MNGRKLCQPLAQIEGECSFDSAAFTDIILIEKNNQQASLYRPFP